MAEEIVAPIKKKSKRYLYSRKYRQENKEKCHLSQLRCRQKNREKYRLTRIKWESANKKKRLLYQAQWKREHKDRVKKYPSMQKRRGIGKPVLRNIPCKRGHIAMRDSHGYCRKCKKDSEKKSKTIATRRRAYKERNREIIKAKNAIYAKNNRPSLSASSAKRRAKKINATPPWADFNKIKDIYYECSHISKKTGILHHVDHVVPLNGKNVCGLHVQTNLQIIEGGKNKKKSNKYECE